MIKRKLKGISKGDGNKQTKGHMGSLGLVGMANASGPVRLPEVSNQVHNISYHHGRWTRVGFTALPPLDSFSCHPSCVVYSNLNRHFSKFMEICRCMNPITMSIKK